MNVTALNISIGLKPGLMEHQDNPFPDDLIQIRHAPHGADEEETDLLVQLELAERELHKPEIDLAITLAKRLRLVRRINCYRTSLASCNKLPSELIGEIIMLTGPELPPLPLADIRNEPRLQYTQICQHWRRAVFDFNQLWNNVDLDRCHTGSPAKLAAAWLRQSSSTQIVLKVSGFGASFGAEYLWKELLVPYSRRLKSLDSILTDANHFHSVPFDTLETLSLFYGPRASNTGGSMTASSLKDFRVTNILPIHNHNLLSFLPSVPWGQLTSISLAGSLIFNDVCDILLQCKVLEHCQLDTITSSSVGMVQDSVHLPRLKSLRIKLGFPHLFHELCLLVTPNLSEFTVNHPPKDPPVLEQLAKFAKVSQRTLHHLEITKSDPHFHGLEISAGEILPMFPFVTHFIAKDLYITPSTLLKIKTGELLPRIQALEFMPRHRIEDIVDILVPRHPIRLSRLRNIYLHTYQRSCSGQRLKDLHSQGINVWVVQQYSQRRWISAAQTIGTWTI